VTALLKTVPASASQASWTCNLEAEQAVLGGLFLDNAALDNVADLIGHEDFYTLEHREIFRTIVELVRNMKPADTVTVFDRMRLKDPDRFGDEHLKYLVSLAVNTPSAANVRRYAEIVRERAIARALFSAGIEISNAVREPGARTIEDLVDQAQERVLAVDQQRARAGSVFQTLDHLLPEVVSFVDRQHERYVNKQQGDVIGVPTGFADLDRMTTGLHDGELIILAARPSMGKSSLALNIIEHAARKLEKWGLYFNLEMGNREQGLRTLGAASRVTVQRLATGRIYQEEWTRVSEAIPKMKGVRIAFNEHAGLTITELRALARRAMRELGPVCLIVVDYLQLMLAGETETNRANQLAEISRGLKLLAKEMHVPILALAQLNRELEKRGNKRPMMSDLRDSGALEQDADVILFIYRDEVYHADSPNKNIAEILIAKQRNGPVGKIELMFSAEHTRFENILPRSMREAVG